MIKIFIFRNKSAFIVETIIENPILYKFQFMEHDADDDDEIIQTAFIPGTHVSCCLTWWELLKT